MSAVYHDSHPSQPAANDWSNEPGPEPVPQTCSSASSDATAPIKATDADLSYKQNAHGHSLNNPPPEGWLYPHKKGIGTGSNLEGFKAEIEARTQRGENCKAIADALNTMGVQTSDRAISRARIKWGMRKRVSLYDDPFVQVKVTEGQHCQAQRKVKTPPPGSEAARLSVKSKVQAMRKAELIRMTKEGMSAEDIYQDLTNRGMELKKGVATVLRLQSAWGLAHDERRWLGNFRHQCHKKAKAQQLDAFSEIAKELGVQDTVSWMREKMSEEAARQARHELALKLMGEHAPANPERRKLQTPRRTGGPYTKRLSTNDDTRPSDSDTSKSDHDSDADLTSGTSGPNLHTKAGLAYDKLPSESYDGNGETMIQHLGIMGMDIDGGYASLVDDRDEDLHGAKGHDGGLNDSYNE